jgi:hypothetical protein
MGERRIFEVVEKLTSVLLKAYQCIPPNKDGTKRRVLNEAHDCPKHIRSLSRVEGFIFSPWQSLAKKGSRMASLTSFGHSTYPNASSYKLMKTPVPSKQPD